MRSPQIIRCLRLAWYKQILSVCKMVKDTTPKIVTKTTVTKTTQTVTTMPAQTVTTKPKVTKR